MPKPHEELDEDRTALGKEAIKTAFLDDLFYMPTTTWRSPTRCAIACCSAGSAPRPIHQARLAHRRLSVGRIPHGAAPRQQPHQSRHLRPVARHGRARLDFDELLAAGGGAGPRQRRPRPAGGLLHRLAGDARGPALGYGIRYEFGIFDQEIVDGWQVEKTDKWLRFGNPWELMRPEWAVEVKFGGTPSTTPTSTAACACAGCPTQSSTACPTTRRSSATVTNTANTLRLWRAEAPESFDFAIFNSGDYYGAVNQKVTSENLSKVLYPNDEQLRGKELRLEQQYFFVSCSLQDMLRILRTQKIPVSDFTRNSPCSSTTRIRPSPSPS
jgi:glycogen phosphorylase